MKRIISTILLGTMLVSVASCGSQGETSETTASGEIGTTAADTTAEYTFPELDMGGESFTVLNPTTTWGFYTTVDLEEQTGESLDDAVYRRNREVEERFNTDLEIDEIDIEQAHGKYRTAIMSGDDIYDIAYIRCDQLASFIADGSLYNLLDYPAMQLERDWWDQAVREKSMLGGGRKLYFAMNDFSLFGFEGTFCCYFNEDMLADLQLEKPYGLVREGKWTMDRLTEYAKAAANLNGDDTFDWSETGNAVYGLVSYEHCVTAFTTGAGLSYITVDKDGQPELLTEREKFYDAIDKIYALTSTEGAFLHINGTGNSSYEIIFKNGRSLFTVAEIKASSKYRDMDATFGIVPIPKYDEAQEGYFSYRTPASLAMSMPKTNTKPEAAAQIIDALAYLSNRGVLPIYYNVKVAQKGLRNEESIEMLDIIGKSRGFEVGKLRLKFVKSTLDNLREM